MKKIFTGIVILFCVTVVIGIHFDNTIRNSVMNSVTSQALESSQAIVIKQDSLLGKNYLTIEAYKDSLKYARNRNILILDSIKIIKKWSPKKDTLLSLKKDSL